MIIVFEYIRPQWMAIPNNQILFYRFAVKLTYKPSCVETIRICQEKLINSMIANAEIVQNANVLLSFLRIVQHVTGQNK